ncbi:hypothetical protein [Flavobacterium gelatinilyticum]|uniref:hypothetical protein n=1 Tax=Flavobacterium gelatinilyticum TaxID=3003260 RepID=UPI00247FED13|nr:hypothetical protein [Flavobacterium gelatinilyticum]
METKTQNLIQLKFREVYVFDINSLQDIFHQYSHKNDSKKTSFGIPFLLCQQENKIIAFASLVLDKDHNVNYAIFENGALNADEKTEFTNYISYFLKKKRNDNFSDAKQLKESSNCIAEWLELN